MITMLYLKLKDGKVCLVYSKKVLSLAGRFRQNELRPFWEFLTETRSTIRPEQIFQFPYNVDMGYGIKGGRDVLKRQKKREIVAFIYRAVRTIVILGLSVTVFLLAAYYLSKLV